MHLKNSSKRNPPTQKNPHGMQPEAEEGCSGVVVMIASAMGASSSKAPLCWASHAPFAPQLSYRSEMEQSRAQGSVAGWCMGMGQCAGGTVTLPCPGCARGSKHLCMQLVSRVGKFCLKLGILKYVQNLVCRMPFFGGGSLFWSNLPWWAAPCFSRPSCLEQQQTAAVAETKL